MGAFLAEAPFYFVTHEIPRTLMLLALLAVCGAVAAWTYRWIHNRQTAQSDKPVIATLDLRFTALIADEFCAGKSQAGDDRAPERLAHQECSPVNCVASQDQPDAPFGAKQIVFHPGKTNVDLYKHLDSGRLVHTHGMIELRGNKPVLKVDLELAAWPPGRYILGIAGDPFFAYCTFDGVE